MKQALVYVGMWLEQELPSVTVNTEFDVMLDDIESNTLMAAVQAGIIPKQLAFPTRSSVVVWFARRWIGKRRRR